MNMCIAGLVFVGLVAAINAQLLGIAARQLGAQCDEDMKTRCRLQLCDSPFEKSVCVDGRCVCHRRQLGEKCDDALTAHCKRMNCPYPDCVDGKCVCGAGAAPEAGLRISLRSHNARSVFDSYFGKDCNDEMVTQCEATLNCGSNLKAICKDGGCLCVVAPQERLFGRIFDFFRRRTTTAPPK